MHLVPTELEVPHDRGGAVQRRALAMAVEQASRGCDVTLLSPGGRNQRIEGVEIVAAPLHAKRPMRDVEYLAKARRVVRATQPDVIHSHGLPLSAVIVGRGAWLNIHTVDFFYYSLSRGRLGRVLFGRILSRFDATVPVSEYCLSQLLTYYSGLKGQVMRVIYNGVDPDHFKRNPDEIMRVSEKYGLARYILYVGRVNEQKGCDLLPPLAAGLRSGTQLVVAGPAGQFGRRGGDPLVDLIEHAGGVYLGAVPEGDLAGLMAGASLLVLPTRRFEMFGMVLVEAGACGVPAVASRIGGIPEAIGEGGHLVTAGSADELSAAVNDLLDAPSRLSALALKAVRNAQRFSWGRIVDDYEELIRYLGR